MKEGFLAEKMAVFLFVCPCSCKLLYCLAATLAHGQGVGDMLVLPAKLPPKAQLTPTTASLPTAGIFGGPWFS